MKFKCLSRMYLQLTYRQLGILKLNCSSIFPGYSHDQHARILEVYFAGLTQGTWKNKAAQAKTYLQFARANEVPILAPTQYDVMAYIIHLKDTLASPGAIMNYISGAKTLVTLLGGDPSKFSTYQILLMKRGVQRLSVHVIVPVPPITIEELHAVVSHISRTTEHSAPVIAALLIGFATLLRQSNLLSSNEHGGSSHTLQLHEVCASREGLSIQVRTTKTRWRGGQGYTIVVPHQPSKRWCPVQAWMRYVNHNQLDQSGPAFQLPGGTPLMASVVLAVLRLALAATGVPNADGYSLHSLRRGGAQACAAHGSSLAEIMQLGSWTSNAVHAYVPKTSITARPRTLQLVG